jgi:hypothetical protein
MEIAVPRKFRHGFEKLAQLKPGSFSRLVKVLESSELSLELKPTVDAACVAIPSEPKADLNEILASIYSLAAFAIGSGDSVDDISSAVAANVITAEEREGSQSSKKLAQALSKRLMAVLNVQNLHVAAKAAGLLVAYPKVFTGARLMTDLRPIFDSEQGDRLIAGIRTHHLRIEYFENGQPEFFYVALDDMDVAMLKDVMDRALKKSEALGSFLGKINLPLVNLD